MLWSFYSSVSCDSRIYQRRLIWVPPGPRKSKRPHTLTSIAIFKEAQHTTTSDEGVEPAVSEMPTYLKSPEGGESSFAVVGRRFHKDGRRLSQTAARR